MHAQLEAIAAGLDAATRRLRALASATPDERWTTRAQPQRWSVGECVAHLNLTTKAFLPDLRAALADPALRDAPAPARYRMDFFGGMLYRVVGPRPRVFGFRLGVAVKTSPAFVPGGDLLKGVTVSEFEQLQEELAAVVRASDGRPLHRMRIRSPFDARVSYNMYAALAIVPRHQHRHLQQAEEVWR